MAHRGLWRSLAAPSTQPRNDLDSDDNALTSQQKEILEYLPTHQRTVIMESRVRLFRYAYAVAAWLFVVGILTQVFLIGLSLLGGRPSWQAHIGLGHGISIVVVLMIIMAYM